MLTRVCRRDNVGWDEEQDRIAQEMVAKQAAVPVSEELQELYNGDPKAYWDDFYAQVKGACCASCRRPQQLILSHRRRFLQGPSLVKD